MAEWLLAGFQAAPAAEAAQPPVEDTLACSSATGITYAAVRNAKDGCGAQDGDTTAPPGVLARSSVIPAPPRAECNISETENAEAAQPAALQQAQQAFAGAATAADAVDVAASVTADGLVNRRPPPAIADSGVPSGSQASVATRENVVSAHHDASAAAPLALGSAEATAAAAAAAATLQAVFSSCDKASDKGSHADGSSGCGSGGEHHDVRVASGCGLTVDGGGDGSGNAGASGPNSEQLSLSDEQGCSTPTQASSGSDGPSLQGNDCNRLKRRLANRASAQRVRQRRRLEFDAMQCKLASMVGDTHRLVARITAAEAARDATAAQLAALKRQLAAEHAAKAALQASTMLQAQVPSGNCQVSSGASLGAVSSPFAAAAASAGAAAGLRSAAGQHPASAGFTYTGQQQPALLGFGPLTTGVPHRRGSPPPPLALHVRRQPHCCIVSSGWAPPAPPMQTLAPHPAAAAAAHPGAGASSAPGATNNEAGAPRSARLRLRQRQGAQPAPQAGQAMSASAAASAHARVAAQLQRCPAMAPQLRGNVNMPSPGSAFAASPRAAGGGGAAAAAALMPLPAQPPCAHPAAAAGSSCSPASSGPARSPFAAFCFLPFAD